MVESKAFNCEKPVVIAEIGTNHNSDIGEARFLISSAAQAGCDYVKFQMYEAIEIVSPNVNAEEYGWDSLYGVATAYDGFDRFLKTPKEWFPALSEHARDEGIGWGVTLHGSHGIQWAQDVHPDFIKVASMDHSNLPLVRELVDSFAVPIVVSLGMADRVATEAVAEVLGRHEARAVLMHCSSLYPPTWDDLRLSNIAFLLSHYGLEVGFSDHTLGSSAATEARKQGATVFEKHITRCKRQRGPDHAFATEVGSLPEYVSEIKRQEANLMSGQEAQFIAPPEQEILNRARYMKSVIAARFIQPNTEIVPSDVYCARPGTGISPADLDQVIGRVVHRPIKAHTPLTWLDFE